MQSILFILPVLKLKFFIVSNFYFFWCSISVFSWENKLLSKSFTALKNQIFLTKWRNISVTLTKSFFHGIFLIWKHYSVVNHACRGVLYPRTPPPQGCFLALAYSTPPPSPRVKVYSFFLPVVLKKELQLISYKRYLKCGDYLSIPEGTGSCGYLFHEIHGILLVYIVLLKLSVKLF